MVDFVHNKHEEFKEDQKIPKKPPVLSSFW